jgi:CHAT domain-containing protein
VVGRGCRSDSDPAIDPMFRCGIALAGANQAATSSAEMSRSGILFADDVVALDLSSVDCVVLSACESGIGEPVAGEGVLGFRRSFSIAGAASVVLSLWKVDDQAARTWMVLFHQAYLDGASDPVAAVRAAHRQFLAQRRQRGLSTHPFYGGAFIASGYPGVKPDPMNH